MPQQSITVEEWLKSRPTVLSVSEFLSSRPRLMSQQDFAEIGIGKAKREEEERNELLSDIANAATNFIYKGLESASFGLASAPETFEPTSKASEIAGAVGDFAGLVLGPGKALKVPQKIASKFLSRSVPRATARGAARVLGAEAFRPAYGAGRLIAHATEEVAGMAALGAVRDLDATSEEFRQNVKDFGIMGGVFGAAKMLDVPSNGVLGWVLRQGGVRALMAVTGQYPEGYLNKENLPNLVWQEAMNTVFVRNGITPGEIISGKYSDKRKAGIIRAMNKSIEKIESSRAKEAKGKIERPEGIIAIAKEYFEKPVKERIKYSDIDIDPNLVDRDVVRNVKDQMAARKTQKGKYKEPRIDVIYDPATKRYSGGQDSNSMLQAIHEINVERAGHGEQLIDDVGVYVKEGGRYRKTRLSTPMDLAYRLLGYDRMQQQVVTHFEESDTIILEVTGTSNGKLVSIFKGSTKDKDRVLKDNQVMWQFKDGDMVPVAVADNLKDKIIWKNLRVPTVDIYNQLLDIDFNIKAMENLPEAKADYEALKAQKINLESALKSSLTDTKFKVNIPKKGKKLVGEVRLGPAIYNGNQVNVIGAAGAREGKIYVKIEGSDTPILSSEISYETPAPESKIADLKKRVEARLGRELKDEEQQIKLPDKFTEEYDVPLTGLDNYDNIIKHGSDKVDFAVVTMSPDEFLRIRKEANAERKVTKEAVEELVAKYKEGIPLDAPIIDRSQRVASSKPIAFEGTHRALAYKELGIDKMTVIEFYKKGERPKDRLGKANAKGVWPEQGTQNDYWNSPFRKEIEAAVKSGDEVAKRAAFEKESRWEVERVIKGEKPAATCSIGEIDMLWLHKRVKEAGLKAKWLKDKGAIIAKTQEALDKAVKAEESGTFREFGLSLGYKDIWKSEGQKGVVEEYVQRATQVPRAVLVKATRKAYPLRKGETVHGDIVNRLLKEGIIKDASEAEGGWIAPDGSYTPNMVVGQYGYSKYDDAKELIGSIQARARHGNGAAEIARGLDIPEKLVKSVMEESPDYSKRVDEFISTYSMRPVERISFETVRDAANFVKVNTHLGVEGLSKETGMPEDLINLILLGDRSASSALSKWLKEDAKIREKENVERKIKVVGKPYVPKPVVAKEKVEKKPKPEKIKTEKVYEEEMVSEAGELDLEKMHTKARDAYETVKAMPETPLPASHQAYLKMRFDETSVGASDISTLYHSLGIGREGPKLKDLTRIEERLRELEDAPMPARVNLLLRDYYAKFKSVPWKDLSGENKVRQEASEIAMMQRVHRNFIKAIQEYRMDNTGKSPIARVLTRRITGSWLDARYQFMKAEEESGHPFYRIYRWASEGSAQKKWEHAKRMRKINSFWDAKPEDQTAVRRHFSRMYRNLDPKGEGYGELTPYQKKYVDAINELMQEMREPVFDYRFKMWMEEVRAPRIKDRNLASVSLDEMAKELLSKKYVRVFRSQDNKVIDEMLEKAAQAYEFKGPKSPEFLMIKQTLMDKFSLGLVQEGAYLPEIFEGVGKSGLGDRDVLLHIDLLGKSHFHERVKLSTGEEINIADMILKSHRAETNLAKQLENYINQVLNVKYLSEPLNALDSLSDIFYKDYKDAKPNAFGRPTPEARAYSFYDYLNLYATRLKGFPIRMGGFGSALKAIQSVFFRSLTVRPMLIIRNFPQRIVTAVNKSFVMDPRYFNARWKNLDSDVKDWFDSFGTNELEMMKNEFLQLQTDYKWSKLPIFGHVWKAAARVGNLYALSDVSNRKFVFSRTWFKTYDAIKDFREGKISQSKMEQIAHINRQRPLEQREFREQIELGNDKMAANINARYQTVNSQWYYGRTERSFAEMTPEGETYSNLITWSKSMLQQTYNSTERMTDGYKRYQLLKAEGKTKLANEALRQSMNGAAQIAGVFLTGAVANAMLNTISLNHKGKYQSYGFDMFTWEFGGVTAEMMTQFTQAIGDFVGAFEGTPQEQKTALDTLLKMADNQGIRQLLPFSKSILSVIESATGRSYISPLYELISKYEYGYPKGITYVDRTFLERFMHGIFASDPSKSEDVRRFTWEHLKDLQRDYVLTENPVQKAWLSQMVERYKYYNDLFQRYTPYEVFNKRQAYELENFSDKFERDLTTYEYQLMKKGMK